MARPTKYKPEYARIAQKMARLGATDIEVADALGIVKDTFYRWVSDRKEFSDSLKLGKAESDKRVERSLYSRANGYEHDEIDIRVCDGQIVQTPIRKHYPPDPTSMIFWLKNRKPEEWRDKQDLEHSGSVQITKIERVVVNK